ncbi:MAG: hypothetical protein NTAFB01_39200 [Nitrospira sp.]
MEHPLGSDDAKEMAGFLVFHHRQPVEIVLVHHITGYQAHFIGSHRNGIGALDISSSRSG